MTPEDDLDDVFPSPNCLPRPTGCLDVTRCPGIGLDAKVDSLTDGITRPKERQMRDVWREVVMRTAEVQIGGLEMSR